MCYLTITMNTQFHTLLGDGKIDRHALIAMRERGGDWYAYQNHAMDSAALGHIQFLRCGAGCTHTEPPARMPDTQFGMGWKYLPVGKVNLELGKIEEVQNAASA